MSLLSQSLRTLSISPSKCSHLDSTSFSSNGCLGRQRRTPIIIPLPQCSVKNTAKYLSFKGFHCTENCLSHQRHLPMANSNNFHNEVVEKHDLNQYWYSKTTCETLCNAVRGSISLKGRARVAFLSTPSLFFSLSEDERKQCMLFDYDKKSFGSRSNFAFYDFNNPTEIDENLHRSFNIFVIDPPFISQSVWENYATTTELLCVEEGAHIICTTVEENAELMSNHFKCKRTTFKPSIPHLVYQYATFANFESVTLSKMNSELE